MKEVTKLIEMIPNNHKIIVYALIKYFYFFIILNFYTFNLNLSFVLIMVKHEQLRKCCIINIIGTMMVSLRRLFDNYYLCVLVILKFCPNLYNLSAKTSDMNNSQENYTNH